MESYAGQEGEDATAMSGYRIYSYRRKPAGPAYRDAVRVWRAGVYAEVPGEAAQGGAGRQALSASSRRHLARYPEGAAVAVQVCGEPMPGYRLPAHRVFFEVAYGWDRERIAPEIAQHRASRRAEAAFRQREVAAAVQAVGGRVFGGSERRNCLDAELDPAALDALAARQAVREVLVHPAEAPAGAGNDGMTTNYGTQAWQYWTDDPSEPPGDDGSEIGYGLRAAIVDQGFNDVHDVLNTASTGSRVQGRRHVEDQSDGNGVCVVDEDVEVGSPGTLDWYPSGSSNDGHGTTVFSILAGDLTDGQDDDGEIAAADEPKYSGMAGEAGVALLQTEQSRCCERRKAIDEAVDLDADVISLSVANASSVTCDSQTFDFMAGDCECRGEDHNLNSNINEAFADGSLVVALAGNNGAGTTCCPCTVWDTGTPVGALTVGGTLNACTSDHNDVRTADIASSSSEGGGLLNVYGGTYRERSVVDLVAPARRRYSAYCDDEYCTDHEYSTACLAGTSYASPAVAAAAILAKDNWIEDRSPASWMDDAGQLKLHMLLMGDRWDGDLGQSGERRTWGYSPRWGAGRLKLRKFDGGGMDAPWRFKTNSVVLSYDDEPWERWVSLDPEEPTQLYTDFDALKVAIWWYEPKTGGDETASDIVLELERYDSTCTTYQGSYADCSFDTKKMVFVGGLGGDNSGPDPKTSGWCSGGGGGANDKDAGGYCWKMVIHPWSITQNDLEQRQRTVHWTFFAEDTDRESPDLDCQDYDCAQVDPTDIERP